MGDSMTSGTVDYEITGHVAVITINRPEKRNAITADMFESLRRIWHEFRADDEARVAVVTGAGDISFSAGADLGDDGVIELDPAQRHTAFLADHTYNYGNLPEEGMPLWKPTIAAVNGYCIGAGLTLAAGMDIRIASANASFAFPEVQWGVPTITGAILLGRVMPTSTASLMLLSGAAITAEEAHTSGLVSEVTNGNDVKQRALAIAERIATNAPVAVRATKEAMIRGLDMPFERSFAFGEYLRRVALDSADADEGLRAFRERRTPHFEGR